MSLLPEVRESYITIIDKILAESDLTTVSEKRVRKGIQETVGYDVTPQKAAIKELIMERWDISNAKQNGTAADTTPPTEAPVTNGHKVTPPPTQSPSKSPAKREAESDEISETVETPQPKKKRKSAGVDADAAFAAKLQAEENMLARPTRGGASRKSAAVKKKSPKKKKKTKNKVSGEDDSDLDGSGSEMPKPKRTGGFHKPLKLSPALSELLGGETILSRPETVSRIWKHIRENDLQDPSDKRQIICDPLMRAVFKQDKVHMFKMTKILNQNLYTQDE